VRHLFAGFGAATAHFGARRHAQIAGHAPANFRTPASQTRFMAVVTLLDAIKHALGKA